jgi:hypothetical protein
MGLIETTKALSSLLPNLSTRQPMRKSMSTNWSASSVTKTASMKLQSLVIPVPGHHSTLTASVSDNPTSNFLFAIMQQERSPARRLLDTTSRTETGVTTSPLWSRVAAHTCARQSCNTRRPRSLSSRHERQYYLCWVLPAFYYFVFRGW